jgi:vacuolar-type H+-ATPase subunit H
LECGRAMSNTYQTLQTASNEALKHLKTVEGELQQRLADAKAATQARIAKAREAAEAAVAQARIDTEKWREATLSVKRSEADHEAAQLVAGGQQEAQRITADQPKGLGTTKSKLLDAVVGEFRA